MTRLRFQLKLTRSEALKYYQGQASTVIVRAETGQTIRFPAEHIRPFVDLNGVNGRFEICFNEANKLHSFQRIS